MKILSWIYSSWGNIPSPYRKICKRSFIALSLAGVSSQIGIKKTCKITLAVFVCLLVGEGIFFLLGPDRATDLHNYFSQTGHQGAPGYAPYKSALDARRTYSLGPFSWGTNHFSLIGLFKKILWD